MSQERESIEDLQQDLKSMDHVTEGLNQEELNAKSEQYGSIANRLFENRDKIVRGFSDEQLSQMPAGELNFELLEGVVGGLDLLKKLDLGTHTDTFINKIQLACKNILDSGVDKDFDLVYAIASHLAPSGAQRNPKLESSFRANSDGTLEMDLDVKIEFDSRRNITELFKVLSALAHEKFHLDEYGYLASGVPPQSIETMKQLGIKKYSNDLSDCPLFIPEIFADFMATTIGFPPQDFAITEPTSQYRIDQNKDNIAGYKPGYSRSRVIRNSEIYKPTDLERRSEYNLEAQAVEDNIYNLLISGEDPVVINTEIDMVFMAADLSLVQKWDKLQIYLREKTKSIQINVANRELYYQKSRLARAAVEVTILSKLQEKISNKV